MPYKMVWVPPEKNENIPVYQERPAGPAYHCHHCKGWIKGMESTSEIDTMTFMAGRRGTVFYCIRCGEETDFLGVIS